MALQPSWGSTPSSTSVSSGRWSELRWDLCTLDAGPRSGGGPVLQRGLGSAVHRRHAGRVGAAMTPGPLLSNPGSAPTHGAAQPAVPAVLGRLRPIRVAVPTVPRVRPHQPPTGSRLLAVPSTAAGMGTQWRSGNALQLDGRMARPTSHVRRPVRAGNHRTRRRLPSDQRHDRLPARGTRRRPGRRGGVPSIRRRDVAILPPRNADVHQPLTHPGQQAW